MELGRDGTHRPSRRATHIPPDEGFDFVSATFDPTLSEPVYPKPLGAFDECRDASGTMRSTWAGIARELQRLGPSQIERREAQIEELIRSNGSSLRAEPTPTDADQETPIRPWQLSVTPMVIGQVDWQVLSAGIQQRVRILEALLSDLLGPQTLIRDRIVPPALLWSNRRFYRSYHRLAGFQQSGGTRIDPASPSPCQRLHVTACDVARDATGQWWVTGDRTRAPSGLGYLLENRIVYSRVFPHLHRGENVQRLAPFFANMRQYFNSLAPRQRDNPRIALLTPGQGSYRGFEDAYLARYLGYTLVQGRDLAVRRNRLNLKTLGGLLPVEVVWRHVADRKCDPLELMPDSTEGVTGLLRCIRGGHVSVVNAIGACLAEMPGLMPFLSAAAAHLTGESLSLPSVATYWCGGESERTYVIEHLDQLVIRHAYSVDEEHMVVPAKLTSEQKNDLVDRIRANPENYIGQAALSHSVTPVWREQTFQPWHVALRAFSLQTERGIDVLPGGLARVSPDETLLRGSPTRGLLTQDCMVISDKPIDHEVTLLPGDDETIRLRRGGAELPSRVAEHFYWLGRNVERCESIARLLRTTLVRLGGENELDELPEMPRLVAGLASVGQLEPDYAIEGLGDAMPSLEQTLYASVLDPSMPHGLHASAEFAVFNATAVRDRMSLDAYRIFRNIDEDLIQRQRSLTTSDGVSGAIECLNQLLTQLLAFGGLTAESMTRTHGWRFVLLGRRIERAFQTAELLLSTLVRPVNQERVLCEAILDATDSLLTYRSRYLALVHPAPTIDMLVSDASNPRSLQFQLDEIESLLRQLPTDASQVGLGKDEQLAASIALDLRIADNNELMEVNPNGHRQRLDNLLRSIQSGLPQLSRAIDSRYLIHTSSRQLVTGDRDSIHRLPVLAKQRVEPAHRSRNSQKDPVHDDNV